MKIRAAVVEELGQPLVVQEVDLVEPKAGEALVRLVACVPHRPLHRLRRGPERYAPCVRGREGAGVVEPVGLLTPVESAGGPTLSRRFRSSPPAQYEFAG